MRGAPRIRSRRVADSPPLSPPSLIRRTPSRPASGRLLVTSTKLPSASGSSGLVCVLVGRVVEDDQGPPGAQGGPVDGLPGHRVDRDPLGRMAERRQQEDQRLGGGQRRESLMPCSRTQTQPSGKARPAAVAASAASVVLPCPPGPKSTTARVRVPVARASQLRQLLLPAGEVRRRCAGDTAPARAAAFPAGVGQPLQALALLAVERERGGERVDGTALRPAAAIRAPCRRARGH